MRYLSYLEGEPTLQSYRLDHAPQPGYSPVFICPFVVLTSESGDTYNLMRGIQGQRKDETMNLGIYKVLPQLDGQCPLFVPFDEVPISEPYWVTETAESVAYVGRTFRLEWGVDRYRWVDASGRFDLTAKRLGQVATFWVPSQPGYEEPQMLRSHLGKVTGTLDGEAVEGLFMLDYIYSRSELMWREMGMLTKLHNLWVNWLVEYDDGSYEGGYAWRGRPGNGFAAAHHCVDGVSTARADARMETERTERGTITRVRLTLGDDFEVVLDQLGSLDWPLHTVGTVASTSRGKQIVKSWNYTEYFPLNWPAVAEYQAAHRSLFGRYPSFQRLMADARIEDEHVVFPERR